MEIQLSQMPPEPLIKVMYHCRAKHPQLKFKSVRQVLQHPESFELLLEYEDGIYRAVTETDVSDFKLLSFEK